LLIVTGYMVNDILSPLGLKATAITGTIFVIQGNNRGRSPFSNAVCVIDKTRALMDTGCGHDIVEKLKREVSIELVILSHSHPDHTAGTWLFDSGGETDITVPREGAESISSADRLAVRFVGHDLAQLWKDTYLPVTGFRDFTYSSRFGDRFEFPLGENRFIALHAPGHLEDHYCMWEPDRKILIGFDMDMSPFGPWYGNPESDIGLFKESIAMIRALPVETYISSHARPMKGPHFMKRIAAYEAVFGQRDQTVLQTLPEVRPVSLDEVVDKSPIYGVDYTLHHDPMLRFGETRMVEKHLAHLAGLGLIEADGQGRYRKPSPG
jgi:glyoxylase-like metal-dependent hydrolase (beta-lactamase superfamily II)